MTGTRYPAGLPGPDDLADVLVDLAVPHEDINDVLALRHRIVADRALAGLLTEAVEALVSGIGRPIGSAEPSPALPQDGGPVGRLLPVYVFVAALSATRDYHRSRGVPADVGRHTLADLGRQMAVHRRRHGTGGIASPEWLRLHFRGELYQLGRLQFQRDRLGTTTGAAVRAAGLLPGPGDPVLSLHIPDFRGPLTPGACDRSLTAAREFFRRHFPEEDHRVAACHSWLLDPQLADHLPEDANIIRFQRRFRAVRTAAQTRARGPADREPVAFVFGDPELPVDTLPRRTTLERAVGDHLRAGGHWYLGDGWFELA